MCLRWLIAPNKNSRDTGKVAHEIILYYTGLTRADVYDRLKIAAEIPDGQLEDMIYSIVENNRTLRFKSRGFDESRVR